jgi:hypothetical protein
MPFKLSTLFERRPQSRSSDRRRAGCKETNWAQTVLQQEPEHPAALLRAGESFFDKTWGKPGEIELQPSLAFAGRQ